MNRKEREEIYFLMFRMCAAVVVLALIVLLGYIVMNGIGRLSLDFLINSPAPNARGSFTSGGIFDPLVGTIMLMLLVLVIAVPVGVFGAIFLVEFLGKSRWSRYMWMVIQNLAGVPSIVYGLLGVGLFVYYLQFGLSLAAAAVTLSLLALPVIMVATREALDAIPDSLREASVALGATKLQTIRHHILPYSASGILTGTILSMSRAGGETAPILVTGVALNAALPGSLLDQFQALPYYIYIMVTQTSDIANAYPMAYAAALVLLMVIIGMNLGAMILRNRYREKFRW